MDEAKVRCKICYSVFNTSKKEGQETTCPMCDGSFSIEKATFVNEIKQSINKVAKDITDYVKEKTGSKDSEDVILREVKGRKYDRSLLELAEELANQNKNKIDKEGSKKLFLKIKDYNDYTSTEKETVGYIRKTFQFTEEADKWLRTEIRKWAAKRRNEERGEDPTNFDFDRGNTVPKVFMNLKDAYNWDNLNNLTEKEKTSSQWAGILLTIVFVLGLISGIAYGLKWNEQTSNWDNEGLSSVHGTVIDKEGDALEGVKVEAEGKRTYTNPQGKYYLYDLSGEEAKLIFVMEGYEKVTVWINLRADGTNILEIEMLEGETENKKDFRIDVEKPWPPNYALAPLFMISAMIALLGSSAALLQQNFRIAITGCLFGILSYGFLLGSILSVVALSLILIDKESFEKSE